MDQAMRQGIPDPARCDRTATRNLPALLTLNFRHPGSETTGHPFGAVLGCRDLDIDTIHIVRHFVRNGADRHAQQEGA
jgi:hypothetical protein